MGKWRIIAALSGFLWLLFGALSGHDALDDKAQAYFTKAHEYHIVHTLALFWLSGLPGAGGGGESPCCGLSESSFSAAVCI